jgi:hypothetical protein
MLVYASELAAVLGRNKYKSQREAFEAMWARVAPAQYKECVTKDACDARVTKRMLAPLLTASVSELSTAAASEGADVTALAQKAEREVEAVVVQQLLQAGVPAEAVAQVQQCESAEAVQSVLAECAPAVVTRASSLVQVTQELKDDAQSQVNCAFGTAREEGSRQQMESDGVARTVTKDNAFRVKWLNERWGIGGRVDGLDEEGRVVEIKNRTRHFFSRVPDYEWVQVQAYLQLMKAREALLVQQLGGQQRVTSIFRNDHEWSHVIMPALSAFMDVLLKFVDRDGVELREAWVAASNPARAVLLGEWIAAAPTQV